jgi:DeoR/GlpR family transcriptional regulator of sugar metabolism
MQSGDRRRELILAALAEGGECRVSDLAQRFGLSDMTVRRDLQLLETRGVLRRVHGGAVLADTDIGYPQRAREGQSRKQRIAQCAARRIVDGMVIYLDSGTTTMEIAQTLRAGLPGVSELTVVTHGINIALALSGHALYSVHMIGGEIYHTGLSTVGPVALAQIAGVNFDVFFMGARGVDSQAGWTNANQLETQLKHAAIAQSRQVCAVADSGKWRYRGLAPIVPFAQVRTWICDAELPADARAAARDAGIDLMLAE